MKRALALVLLTAPALAQSNADPGIDVRHGPLNQLTFKARQGEYPQGLNSVAMSTTSCNVGSVDVPWFSTDENCFGCGPGGGCQMVEEHPFIAFMLAREANGRFEQISDYSHVKHGFFALSDSQCDPCQNPSPSGNFLGVGCSDTYSHFNNGDDYYLGPAEEIDPWLGTWDRFGSLFDRGVPDVGFPANQDGVRSWCVTPVIEPLGFKVQVSDEDLLVPDAEYFYQGSYVIRAELEENRENNAKSKQFVPTWNGNGWSFQNVGGSATTGTILNQWTAATVSSASNGEHDGRVYVGVHVLESEQGYRYEIAVHNRDAHRKVGSLALPLAAGARVFQLGFGDLDRDTANDWSPRRRGDQLIWRAPADGSNPLRWNSVYNFWFESDAAPLSGAVVYGAHDPGPGDDFLAVEGLPLPLDLTGAAVEGGCSFGAAPRLVAVGAPPVPLAGNATFGLRSAGNDPGALGFGLLRFDAFALPFGCGEPLSGVDAVLGPVFAGADGVLEWPLPIPASAPPLGLSLQVATERELGGPVAGRFDLSSVLRLGIEASAAR